MMVWGNCSNTIFDTGTSTFVPGTGQMISGLNYNFGKDLIGMKEGEEKTITLPPENGYGNYDPQNIIIIQKTMFKFLKKLKK